MAEVLARTGHVQLERIVDPGEEIGVEELATGIERFEELERRYGAHWAQRPQVDRPASEAALGGGSPQATFAERLDALMAWSRDVDPILARIDSLDVQEAEHALVEELLTADGAELPGLDLLRAERNSLVAELLALPLSEPSPELPPLALRIERQGTQHRLICVVCARDDLERLRQAAAAAGARRVTLPDWLPGQTAAALALLDQKRNERQEARAKAGEELQESCERHGVDDALSDLRSLRWFAEHVPPPRYTHHFAVLMGFTDDPEGEIVRQALASEGIAALLHFGEAPAGLHPPTVLRNPRWVRPFELFAKLVGIPGVGEVDPTVLLAAIAPLLFGFMFGDVGQGAVLIVVGLLLRKRFPSLRLLVFGGASAIVFGLLFGSVFGMEGLIPALWFHPMEHPLRLLLVALYGGAAILLLGLILRGVGMLYRVEPWIEIGGQRRTSALAAWALMEVGPIAIYLGLLLAAFFPPALWLSVAGAVYFLFGNAFILRSIRAIAAALGRLIEHLFQLGVNTVSFARVGAFALAHAGLSTAIHGLVSATEGLLATSLILILGNALVLVIEGLVVSIQTTRLLLFEFFVRFFEAKGRPFRPLAPPPGSGRRPTDRSDVVLHPPSREASR